MSRPAFAAAAGITLTAVALLLAPPPSAGAPVGGEPGAEVSAADERLAELAGTLEALLVIVAAERPDALSIPEAEEMAVVAEELIQEGEADLAGSLLEEAIALLEEEAG
ncbi:hypothetical protein K8I85_03915 [bacterium]|nr:hypothetical protein [bacterium]